MRPLVTVSMFLVALVPAVAWPCSGPGCSSIVVAVPAGGAIPSNAAAVGFQDSLFSEAMWDGGLELQTGWVTGLALSRTTDAGAVMVTVTPVAANDGKFAVPSNGFVIGETYGLRALGERPCGDAGASFTVAPPAPWPTSSATLALEALAVRTVEGSWCGGPAGLIQYAVLTLTPTPDMEPWLSLTRWELEVDGQNWATSGYGRVKSGVTTGGLWDAMHFIDNFHVQCGPGTTDAGRRGDDRLGPGVHAARLLARVAGFSTPIASNTISITFDCATDTWDAGVGPEADAGQNGGDGGCVEDLDAGIFCPGDGGTPFDAGFIDAGVTSDGGPPADFDGGGADAGASDAGGRLDAGVSSDGGASADGGTNPEPEDQGCGGCAHVPLEALAPLLSLLALRRRRASPSLPEPPRSGARGRSGEGPTRRSAPPP